MADHSIVHSDDATDFMADYEGFGEMRGFTDELGCEQIAFTWRRMTRSEEHTSELQSPCNLVCRLLLEKKNKYHVRIVHVLHTGLEVIPHPERRVGIPRLLHLPLLHYPRLRNHARLHRLRTQRAPMSDV